MTWIIWDNPPSCLDAAYERRAVEQGLNSNPVFDENKQFDTGIKNMQIIKQVFRGDYNGINNSPPKIGFINE